MVERQQMLCSPALSMITMSQPWMSADEYILQGLNACNRNKLCYAGQQQHGLFSPALYMVTMSQPSSSGVWWGPAPLPFVKLPVLGFLGTNLGSCTRDTSLSVWSHNPSTACLLCRQCQACRMRGRHGAVGEAGLRQVSPNKISGAQGSRRWFPHSLGAPAARQCTKV